MHPFCPIFFIFMQLLESFGLKRLITPFRVGGPSVGNSSSGTGLMYTQTSFSEASLSLICLMQIHIQTIRCLMIS